MVQLIFKCELCGKETLIESKLTPFITNKCSHCNSIWVFPTFKNYLGVKPFNYQYKNGKFITV
jgi:hypothetical protein